MPAQAPPAAVARCISSQPGIGTVGLRGQSMGGFTLMVAQFVDRPVIDRTGLTGFLLQHAGHSRALWPAA
jgi:uncharacterized protein (TIGR03435 family)